MLTRNRSPSRLTAVQQRVAREIIALVRRGGQRPGSHLTELGLAEQLGTSRSPVRAALHYLVECGVLERDATHGLALIKDAEAWSAVAERFAAQPDDPVYRRIAEERRRGLLPEVIGEAELMRRYAVARSTLRKVLARISEEGWIEPRVGRGWSFLPMIDSHEAYAESCLYRQAIEPSGLLGPAFEFVPAELQALRREQRCIVEGDGRDMTPIERFEANRRFHETLARWSHNRFIVQSVRRVHSLRRSFEERDGLETDARTSALEHLEILDAIEARDLDGASLLLRVHLSGDVRAIA
jgi:DNA-binding GntR family transcriptional regulator